MDSASGFLGANPTTAKLTDGQRKLALVVAENAEKDLNDDAATLVRLGWVLQRSKENVEAGKILELASKRARPT